MTKQDLLFFYFSIPFLGGFISFLFGSWINAESSALGVMVILGVIAGYLALIALILGKQSLLRKDGDV